MLATFPRSGMVIFRVRLAARITGLLTAFLACGLEAAQFRMATQTFTVPDGFEVEQVAGPPIVERPISGSFDEQGRLYVTDSSGSNAKVEQQEIEKPHRVRRLEPADDGGRFTQGVVFAEHLMFPEGCLWFNGSLYVSAPPSIWKLTDTDNNGLADERSEWHEGKTVTGCANDLHGPYLGLDGWIYWCKGAFARQTYPRAGRHPFTTRASHIFRAPPEHTELEPVLTCGMDNPVGVVFTLSGEPFMCGTFLLHPEAGKRDGIVHAVYGGMYGKPNDVLDEHPKTGDLLPIMTHLGAAAPCSVIRYESASFGPTYRDNLFVCCFNLHKVTRHVLQPDGASFKTIDSDFLVSDNPDFHPTDVIEDADGSLLVIDTGGWYKLCCPTSQLSKPDVLGAIYRIRRVGAPPVTDPRGLTIDWAHLGAAAAGGLLGDARAAVRKRALQVLARLGPGAVLPLSEHFQSFPDAEARANVVWALTRIEGASARATVRAALADPAEVVRHAAIHSVALWRDREAERQLLGLMEGSGPQLQRAAAEALGRIGDPASVPALLQLSAQSHDRFLEHSLIFAMIEIDAPAETAKGLAAESATERRAALIALDQMEQRGLAAQTVAPLLSSPDALLRQTAAWIIGHHPKWGDALAGYFQTRLDQQGIAGNDAEEFTQQLAEFSSAGPIEELVGARLSDGTTPPAVQRLLLRAIASTSLKEPPPSWVSGVAACLAQPQEPMLRAGVAAARALSQGKPKPVQLAGPLMRVARDAALPEDLRLAALDATPAGSVSADAGLMDLLLSSLDTSKPVLVRAAAAGVLAKAKLTEDQLLRLADRLKSVGPLEVTTLLGCFEPCQSETVGARLVQCLRESKGRASLRPETLQKLLERFPASVQESGQALLASLQTDRAEQSAHLENLLGSLGKGDVRRGQAVFNSQKAACSSCHAMGYLGGHVGPDLTSIGQTRTERDLLESIVYPSASFVRSFEPYIVKTRSDDEYSGVMRKDSPQEIVLATGPSTEVRIARSDIVDIRPGAVSVMPAGLEQLLTHQELADLIAFLKATKWGAQ